MKKNLLFYIDESFAHFGIAKSIHEKSDYNIFTVIDVNEKLKIFFETQKIISFQKIWNIRNIDLDPYRKPDLEYLKSFEKKFNINIWQKAYADNGFIKYNKYYNNFKHDEILSILEQECKLFENIFNQVKIDFLILKLTDHHRIQLLFEIIKSLGIKTLMLNPTRIGYRVMISSDFEIIDSKNDLYTDKNKDSIIYSDIDAYMEKFNIFEQGKKRSSFKGSKKPNKFSRSLQFVKSAYTKNHSDHYTNYGKTSKKLIFEKFLERPFRNWINRRFFDKHAIHEINSENPFVYFPLHVEPERTITIFAPFYTNQFEVIIHLAKSLPIGYKLYVKEHPFMIKIRPRDTSYYQKIIELPNVEFIHPSVNPNEILKKCSMVATISGTSAFEAAFYKKPSIVFSDVSFSFLPFVYRIKNLNELSDVIKNLRNKKFDFSEIAYYVSLVDKNSFEFDIVSYYDNVKTEIYQYDVLQTKPITEDIVNVYLQNHKSEFDLLGKEYLNKINQYD